MSKTVSEAIFDARLKGKPVGITIAYRKRVRTEQVIALWRAGVLAWTGTTRGLGKGFAFNVKEDLLIRPSTLLELVRKVRPLPPQIVEESADGSILYEAGENVMILRLDPEMIAAEYCRWSNKGPHIGRADWSNSEIKEFKAKNAA